MKARLLLLLLSCIFLSYCHAQRIESQQVFGGYKYSQDGRSLNLREMRDLMTPGSEAYTLMGQARTNNTIATIIGLPGGGLLGWAGGSALAGGDPKWELAAIGTILIVASIPFSIATNERGQQAVALYNEGGGNSTSSVSGRRTLFTVGPTNHGYGLAVGF